jgi:UDP-N-acetylmuramyl pentapeptide phosphotransferase/UDP-N-acetylglucosamine-1-phosphate transferase
MPNLPSLPPSVYMAGIVSLAVALLLILTQRWHGRFTHDLLAGVQKVHVNPTPRIGGVAIFVGLVAAYVVAQPSRSAILGPIILAGLPAFLFGVAEDITKTVGVAARLLATIASGVLGWWIAGYALTSVNVPLLDSALAVPVISVVVTAVAVGGVANAVNIVDGFNGLASGFLMVAFFGVGAVALHAGDADLAVAAVALLAATLGFWVVNWPWGKLFLGDGGSYFCGFGLAWVCVMLVERNAAVSAFAPLLICSHPVTEVLFSIYRRRIREDSPGRPDRLHLHSLVMRRLVSPVIFHLWSDDKATVKRLRNPITGLVLGLMSVPPVAVAYLFAGNTPALILAAVVVVLGYVTLYARLVRFHWCSPLSFLLVKPRSTSGLA